MTVLDGLLTRLHVEREEFLAQFDAERAEFLRWLYESTSPAESAPLRRPVERPDWLASAACGDCEHRPCECRWADDDLWIPGLADHDDLNDLCEVHHQIREVA